MKLWIAYCRSILEQSCIVWDNSLTEEKKENLERTQITFVRFLLGNEYRKYEDGLLELNLESLSLRRKKVNLKFAEDGSKMVIYQISSHSMNKKHCMKKRNNEKYKVLNTNTERLRKSSIVEMQYSLNNESVKKKKYDFDFLMNRIMY